MELIRPGSKRWISVTSNVVENTPSKQMKTAKESWTTRAPALIKTFLKLEYLEWLSQGLNVAFFQVSSTKSYWGPSTKSRPSKIIYWKSSTKGCLSKVIYSSHPFKTGPGHWCKDRPGCDIASEASRSCLHSGYLSAWCFFFPFRAFFSEVLPIFLGCRECGYVKKGSLKASQLILITTTLMSTWDAQRE